MSDLIINLQEFTQSLPPVLQWVGVVLAAMIPYVEAEGAAVLGIVVGMHPAVAIPFAVLGNAIVLAIVVWVTSAVRRGVSSAAAARDEERAALASANASATSGGLPSAPQAPVEANPKKQRMRRVFDRYGVPGVALLGPLLLPSHVTAAAMVGFGAPRVRVYVWSVVSVALWATVIAILVYLGVQVALH